MILMYSKFIQNKCDKWEFLCSICEINSSFIFKQKFRGNANFWFFKYVVFNNLSLLHIWKNGSKHIKYHETNRADVPTNINKYSRRWVNFNFFLKIVPIFVSFGIDSKSFKSKLLLILLLFYFITIKVVNQNWY